MPQNNAVRILRRVRHVPFAPNDRTAVFAAFDIPTAIVPKGGGFLAVPFPTIRKLPCCEDLQLGNNPGIRCAIGKPTENDAKPKPATNKKGCDPKNCSGKKDHYFL